MVKVKPERQSKKHALLNRLDDTPLYEKVFTEIRRALMAGQIFPNEIITIRSLAGALGTSTMPVREALHRLVTMQGLELLPSRTFVIPAMTRARFKDLSDARAALESLVVERCLLAITRDQLRGLDRLCDKMAEALKNDDMRAYLQRNQEFHFKIYEVAQSPVFMNILESLWLQLGPYLSLYMQETSVPTHVDTQHRSLVTALRDGNGEVAKNSIIEDIQIGAKYFSPAC